MSAHRYIDAVGWDVMGPPLQVGRDGGVAIPPGGIQDSARYGAHQIAAAGGRIYMLFGGRPKRPLHEEEPTRMIDVYRSDGSYEKSFSLPFSATGLATDGRMFYVLRLDPVPSLVGLRAPD